MTKFAVLLAGAAFAMGSINGAQAQSRPSWCSSQSSFNSSERAVCDNRALWGLDDRLTGAYRAALDKDRSQRSAVEHSEEEWINVTRNGCGADVTCLSAVYNRRIEVLEGVARTGHM